MSGEPPRARRVACPGCGASAEYSPANPWRPFCSERCRLSDLGAWASESYRIPLRREAGEGDDPVTGEDPETRPQS